MRAVVPGVFNASRARMAASSSMSIVGRVGFAPGELLAMLAGNH